MKQTRISNYQLALMIMLFMIGNTPLVGGGTSAKQDAWIVYLIGALVGGLFLWMLLILQRRSPEADLPELFRQLFGTWLGWVLVLPQGIIFAYQSSRNIRDFSDMTVMTILTQTPEWSIKLIIVALSLYAIWGGVQYFFRLAELLFPIVLFSYVFLILLIMLTGLPDFHRLQPVLGNGWGPILREVFPSMIAFPFGQMLTMLLFWKYVTPKDGLRSTTLSAYGLISLFIIFMKMLSLAVLGPGLLDYSTIPLLEVAQLIRLADFLERLDVVVTLLLVIGLFIKLSLLMLAAVLTISALFKLPYRVCAAILAPIIYGVCFLEPNSSVHEWIGEHIVIPYVIPGQMLLVVIAFLVGFVRKSGRQSTG
ncbi:GerAB/ArcD/ProY family transporter [Paenibacillus daejeonensis]|uniref:GerAB/ArcD/ProY family transporter n=1 Tax=Paenibacillus daejeonensis TaxID=135193 RepID=UPI00037A6F33|nr:GerAB/ArcD/ProY family transporter [Paenibacillus daejeonensis]